MEKKLFRLITNEEPKLYSKEELWIAVEKFVYSESKKYLNLDSFDEILSIVFVSFTKAYNKYNIDSKTTFPTYLSTLIRNDVLDEYKYSKKGKIYYNNRKKEELSMEAPISIDKDGNEISFQDILTIENTVYDYIENKELINTINFCINNILTEKEKIVLYYRLESLTQQKISDILGVSRSYISRLELKACNKIRKYLKKNKLI